ncbi:MAG: hypothetical protein U1E53_04720 [Dongiaceae bacterium]
MKSGRRLRQPDAGAAVLDNVIRGNRGGGVRVVSYAYRDNAFISQDVVVTTTPSATIPATASSCSAKAFFEAVVISQDVTLTGNAITSNGGQGIDDVSNFASGDGALVSQYLSIGLNTIAGNDNNGIRVFNRAYAATVTQDVRLTSNFVSSNGENGIFFSAYAHNFVISSIDVYVAAGGNRVTSNGADGSRAYQNGNGRFQHFTLGTQDSVTFNTGHGINLSATGGAALHLHTGRAAISERNGLTPQVYAHGPGTIIVLP